MSETKNTPRPDGTTPLHPDTRQDGFSEKRNHVPPTTIHIPRPQKPKE